MNKRNDGNISMDAPFRVEDKLADGTCHIKNDSEKIEYVKNKEKNFNESKSLNSDPLLEDSLNLYGLNPGISQLEEALKNMEEGERNINKIERANNSPVYKGFKSAYDSILEIFGKERNENNIYEMLSEHQKDVFMVNYIVMSMTKSYEKNLEKITERMIELYDKEEEIGSDRHKLTFDYELAKRDYIDSKEKLSKIDREEDPSEFNEARKIFQEAKSRLRKLDSENRINSVSDIGYKQSSAILEKQKDIFEELLYTIKEFGAKTAVYQQTLNHLTSTCEATKNLSEAGTILSDGLRNLESIKSAILGQYKKDIVSIIHIASGDEIGKRALNDNQDLAKMSADLTYASKMRSGEYELQKKLMQDI